MVRESCPLHALDDYAGVWVGDDVGYSFTCSRRDHPVPGPFTWFRAPEPPSLGELSGIADELRLDLALPAALSDHRGTWIEYGVLERAYALANPEGWNVLIDRYSHTAIAGKRYTATAFLAGVLGRLWQRGAFAIHAGPATGRWSYNRTCGYFALFPEPDWESRLSWADSGFTVEYVPGQE